MKKYLIYATIAIVGLVTVYQKVYVPKHTYNTLSLQKGDVSVKVNGIGNVSARDIYKIGSIYGGKVLNFYVKEGSFVKKGELLASIDSVDLEDKIKELKASIKKINSDIKSLKIDKQSANSSYNYQNEIFKKNQKLYNKRAISQLDYQKYKTNKEIAQLKVKSVDSRISSILSSKEQLSASLSGLNERLKRYTILSPISGYITKKLVSNYQIIMPNQTLLQIVNPKDVWIATHIDTRISTNVKIGNKASIKLRSSDKEYVGTVVNIRPYNNSITYEREVDVAFDNLPIPFYLEEQAIVNIDIKKLDNTIKVPTKALTLYKQKEGVWIVKNGKVNFKALKILAYENNYAATNELSEKDKLVIPNPSKKALSNNMSINTKN